jgi:hypothetical protein
MAPVRRTQSSQRIAPDLKGTVSYATTVSPLNESAMNILSFSKVLCENPPLGFPKTLLVAAANDKIIKARPT